MIIKRNNKYLRKESFFEMLFLSNLIQILSCDFGINFGSRAVTFWKDIYTES